ncbi:MAG: leucine-rich repeat-containing protein kinase family protein [Oceanospirillaceae bacterium]
MLFLHTLIELRSGKLLGTKHLALSDNLTQFPLEILSLADSLEILDLSNNQLSSLPKEIAQLKKLKILFASNNQFTTLPEALGACTNLQMIGFKSNQINYVPADSLPLKLRWLILTGNQIEVLPDTLGERKLLQKLTLAGNQLTSLPENLNQLHNLELVRISANNLKQCPDQLLSLPKLAWLAFAGNPFSQSPTDDQTVPNLCSTDLNIGEVLGQGASGIISKAQWNNQPTDFPNEIAVKVFKGDITSDGYPEDELQACLKVGNHPNLIQSLAQVNEPDFLALIMNLIPNTYKNLGLPPCFESCTRDNFSEGFYLSIEKIQKIVSQMMNVFEHLHEHKVCHGDLYAHNTLIDEDANLIFGDFGAASRYHMLNMEQQSKVKRIEQRALSYFIADLLSICINEDKKSVSYKNLAQKIIH